MKKFCLILVWFIITLTISAQVKTDLQKENLKGNVKSFTVTTYEAEQKNGTAQKGAVKSLIVYKFNDQGYKTEIIDLAKAQQNIYKYDDKGNLVLEDKISLAKKYKLVEDFEEDKKNAINVGTRYMQTIYRYNEKSQLIEWNESDKDGMVVRKHYFSYDDKGNMLSESNYYGKDLGEKAIFKYDLKGNRIQMVKIEYLPNGNEGSRITYNYTYDDKGREILSEYYNLGKPIKSSSKYDGKGQLTSLIISSQNGNINQKYTYKYDEKGNIIVDIDGTGTGYYTYKYDNVGNWISKTMALNKRPYEFSERVIKY